MDATSLDPDQVVGYLAATGWRRLRRYANTWVWWCQQQAGHTRYVLLPDSAAYDDYLQRMNELLATVADAEGRDPVDVLATLIRTTP